MCSSDLVPGQKFECFENSYRMSEEVITMLFHLCDLMKCYLGVVLKLNALFFRNLVVLQKFDINLKETEI